VRPPRLGQPNSDAFPQLGRIDDQTVQLRGLEERGTHQAGQPELVPQHSRREVRATGRWSCSAEPEGAGIWSI
jgi:hypothetical protein